MWPFVCLGSCNINPLHDRLPGLLVSLRSLYAVKQKVQFELLARLAGLECVSVNLPSFRTHFPRVVGSTTTGLRI